jgi:uncharacterized protein with HEPN domain
MWRDNGILLDILNAARRMLRYTSTLTEEEFLQNELVQDAVVRQLIILGEAARRISQETKDAHPKVPWGDIAGMRNRLIHEYFRVDLGKVWDTIKNDLPRLIPLIEPLVPPNEE